MNKLSISLLTGTSIIALAAGIGLGKLMFSGQGEKSAASGPATAESPEASTWTCSMHPQIQQPGPGDCPICGMDLIPLASGDGDDEGPRVLSMSEASRALADIQTSTVVRDYPQVDVRLVGRLDYDQTREKSLTARFPARIDELYVNYTGIRVNKGEHLATVYSPDLLTAQRELLTAWRADPDSSITRAAREKLRLWDLLPEQIDAIIQSGEATDHFVLKAPVGGVVMTKNVKEGDYVKTGEPLFRIVDLSVLWAYLDAYESDLTWLRYGQDVSFTVESFPGETFHGQIAFIEPEVNRRTRTIPIRVNVPNEDGLLKPGMFVRAVVKSGLADDGKVYAPEFSGKWISPMHPEIVKDEPGVCDICGMDLVPAESLGYVDEEDQSAPLIIPASSVLRTGKRAVVYVEMPDASRPTYQGREIVLGPRAGDYFIVVDGLSEGETVVTNGAFKIDSALQIKAKPSMMNPEGGGSMPGHNHEHGGMTSNRSEDGGGTMAAPIEIPSELAVQLAPHYLSMQSALASDDLEAAKAGAQAMMSVTGHSGDIADLLHGMLAADSLDSMRVPGFEALSNAMIASIKSHPDDFEDEWMVMHCPMAKNNTGADWLQVLEPLRNPYFGSKMLKCGRVSETIGGNTDKNHIDQDSGNEH